MNADPFERIAALQASRDLLRATMDASTDMIQVFEAVRDQAGTIIDFRWVLNNHAAEAHYGEVRGQRLLERNPGVVAEGIFAAFCRVTDTGIAEQAERHYVHEQFDGWFFQSVVKLGDGVATTTKDISGWKASQAEVLRLQHEMSSNRLAESESRLAAIFANAPVGLSEITPDGRFVRVNAELCRILGRSREALLRSTIIDVTHPDDVEPSLAVLREAAATWRSGTLDKRYRRPDGSEVWASSTVSLLPQWDGESRRFLIVTADLTARRQADEAIRRSEARQRVLVAELQHRTRNLMGVVRAIADKTARASTDLKDFLARYRDRLDALTRVQRLLSRTDEITRVTFDELVRTELDAVGGGLDRVTLDGPAGVALRSSTVQVLAMALHELATNAVKYGALGQPQARLVIRWRLGGAAADGRPLLHVDWREQGVTMPAATGRRTTGQGRELLEKALPYQLDAQTSYAIGADGVHCTIVLPVSHRTR
ncbi:sensor histidine kinase [Sphingomonas sp. CLY1604]|uniref:sensor histidine kinase n=1 Tax=Sphingomonas sp. CLY1604 TaxID=3457786 RepID=UPI003FD7B1A4